MKQNSLAYNIIIECCLADINIDKLNLYLNSFENWDRLFYSANKHGVLPLVYKSLKNEKLSLPADVLRELKLSYVSIAKNNMLISAELVKVFKLFKKHSISAIALKGPTLSQLNYNDVTLRQYADLDILVDKNSLYDAAKLLVDNNYEANYPIEFSKNNKHLLIRKDLQLKNNDYNILIELHWRFLDNKLLNIENKFFNQYQEVSINNEAINTFKNESLLLYLCIHGSKHFWERLEWIVDIDRLIRHNNLEWTSIQSQANSMQADRLFYMGLLVATSLFDTPLPKSIRNELTRYKELYIVNENILNYINDDIVNTKENRPLPKEALNDIKILLDNKPDSMPMITKLFKLRDSDVTSINLPKYLSHFYYLFPLARILKRIFRRIKFIFVNK